MDPFAHATVTHSDEGELLDRFFSGDHAAFDELMLIHQECAIRVAKGLIRDEAMALDIVQEAFLRVMRHGRRYDRRRPFRAWFLRIVRNLAFDYRRHLFYERVGYECDPTTTQQIGSALDQKELQAHLEEVLLTLPGKYHDLLVLREVDGVRADQIAKDCRTHYGTTRWRIHQARKLFRQAWQARFGAM